MFAVSTQSIVLLFLIPFLLWGIISAGFIFQRRRKLKFNDAKKSAVFSSESPTGRPLSSIRGGVWLGGMAVSWPFAILELYPSDLVLRSPQGVFSPVVLPREAIGRVRIERGLLGVSLKVDGRDGREIDFSYRGFSTRALRETLSNAGWLGLLQDRE